LPRKSWVKLSQVRTLSVERVGDVIDVLPPETVSQLIDGLNEIIG
jgi:mRNA interferase MazF